MPATTPAGTNPPVHAAAAEMARAVPVPMPAPRIPLPARPSDAPTGTAFARAVADLGDHERYAAARDQILAGNVPDFLRTLVPVTLRGAAAAAREVTVFVTPDYLSVGSEQDFLPIPLDFLTAASVAGQLGFALPTTRIVDVIYAQASVRLAPIPLPAGPQMRSMAYILEHRARVSVERASAAGAATALVAGTQKDVVLTNRLRDMPDREAIYGWHRTDGTPIQPLSLVHGVGYADYSHGIRLVADTVLVDGRPRRYLDVLADPDVAPILSREGAIPDAAELLARVAGNASLASAQHPTSAGTVAGTGP
jgi:hypothetical protein